MRRERGTYYIRGRFLGQPTTGVQRYAREILNALDRILDQRPEGTSPKFCVIAPKDVSSIPKWNNIAFRTSRGLTGHAWEQLEFPMLAASGESISLCGMPSVAASRQIVVLHDAGVFDIPEAYSKAFRTVFRLSYKMSALRKHKILTVSEFSRDRLSKVIGVPAERIGVAPCGADHIRRIVPDNLIFDRFPQLLKEPYVLSVGSMAPHKNFKIIDAAASNLSGSSVQFAVVGRSGARAFPGQKADNPNLLSLGSVSDEELVALYGRAACFVLPSLYEGFGIPAVEAMALGCPVVASNRTALPETCGNAALLFDPLSVDDLCLALQKVLSSETLQATMRAAGLERASQLTWEASAQSLLQSIQQEWH